MIVLLVLTALVVFWTGPAGRDIVEERRRLRERPAARVVYLPSACCRDERQD